MALTDSKYEADGGDIHYIRLDAGATAVANNTAPTGAINSDIKCKVSKTNREHGLRPRMVRLRRRITAGTGDTAVTASKYARVPILTEAAFSNAAFNIGAEVTYKTQTWTVVGKVAEDY